MGKAPIALFAYNRPEYLRRAIAALARCPELTGSPLVIYCDGAKTEAARAAVAETRRVAHDHAPGHARIVEREHNLGLAASMRAGVGELCSEHGRAIVVEDDLEVSRTFLQFMNAALDRYADEPRVMQISGYMFPVAITGTTDAMFLPLISCWGWGVWARSWERFGSGAACHDRMLREPALRARFDLGGYPYFEMLQAQRRGEIDSWGITWYLDVFANNGLVLYPRTSLVANRGHDGSGAHREQGSVFEADAHDAVIERLPAVFYDDAQVDQLGAFMHTAGGGIVGRVRRFLGHTLRRR